MKSVINKLIVLVAIVAVAIGIVPNDTQLKTEEGSLVKSELAEPVLSSEEDGTKESIQPEETHEELIKRLVAEVESGKAGNGEARKQYLGKNYSEVQKIINKKYEKKVVRTVSKTISVSHNSNNVSYSKSELQSYAKDLVVNMYGWSEGDFDALVNLWGRESGWNPNSHNKSSGAHGIPQALPAKKMASEGSDYYTNGKTQIRWGLKYIKNRYGSPSSAWQHFKNKGWY